MARAALDMGFRVGLGGTVTYPAPGKDAMLAALPLSQIVLETDCPYLAPLPFRKERNDPTFLGLVVAHLARIRPEDEATLVAATSANARDLFRLDAA
jgi:TatD DNase family protein